MIFLLIFMLNSSFGLVESQSAVVMRLVLYNFCASFALFLCSLLYLHYCNVKDYIQILHCGIPKRTFPLDLRYIVGNYTGKGGTKKLSRYVDDMINYRDLWPLYSFEEIFPYRRFDGTYDFIYIKGKEAWRMSCPIKRLDMNQSDFTCYDVTVPDPVNDTQLTERHYAEFNCTKYIQSRKNFVSKRRWTEVRRWGMIYIHSPIEGVRGEEDLMDEKEAGPYSRYYGHYRIFTRALRETIALTWLKASFIRNFFPRTWPQAVIHMQDRIRDFKEMLTYHFIFYSCMPDWDIGDILYFWMPDFHIEFLFNIG